MIKTLIFVLTVFLAACSGDHPIPGPELMVELQASGSKASLRGIAVKNDQEAWVTGTNGTVLRTLDGGNNWHKILVPDTDSLDFRDIELTGHQGVLLMSAGPGSASRIYKSMDQGVSWKTVYVNPHEKGFYNGFDFWDDHTGILIGDAIDSKLFLMKTKDAGESWQRIGETALPDLVEGEYGFAASGTGIFTFGDQKVWIATGGMAARVFYSQDGGESWQVTNTPMISGKPSTGNFSITFKNEMTGIAVGGDYAADSVSTGNVILSGDGGKSWIGIENPETIPFKSCVSFLGNDSFLAIGTSGISVSHDNGQSWTKLGNTSFHTMDFNLNKGLGWMAGGDGQIGRFSITDHEK